MPLLRYYGISFSFYQDSFVSPCQEFTVTTTVAIGCYMIVFPLATLEGENLPEAAHLLRTVAVGGQETPCELRTCGSGFTAHADLGAQHLHLREEGLYPTVDAGCNDEHTDSVLLGSA